MGAKRRNGNDNMVDSQPLHRRHNAFFSADDGQAHDFELMLRLIIINKSHRHDSEIIFLGKLTDEQRPPHLRR